MGLCEYIVAPSMRPRLREDARPRGNSPLETATFPPVMLRDCAFARRVLASGQSLKKVNPVLPSRHGEIEGDNGGFLRAA